jgi:hypothetical protein
MQNAAPRGTGRRRRWDAETKGHLVAVTLSQAAAVPSLYHPPSGHIGESCSFAPGFEDGTAAPIESNFLES